MLGQGSVVNPTILLADDHDIVRRGIRALLADYWQICGEAANGEEAVRKAQELNPSLILMDVSMPLMSGLEATRRIRKLQPATKIVILSMHDSGEIVRQARAAGADACLAKTCGSEVLLETIATLLGDGVK